MLLHDFLQNKCAKTGTVYLNKVRYLLKRIQMFLSIKFIFGTARFFYFQFYCSLVYLVAHLFIYLHTTGIHLKNTKLVHFENIKMFCLEIILTLLNPMHELENNYS